MDQPLVLLKKITLDRVVFKLTFKRQEPYMNEQDLGCRLLEVQMNRLLHTAQFSLQFSFLFNNLVFLHVN